MVLFDIIIPSYNNKDELLKCLNGFSKQTLASKDFKVFVCIDGSTDGTIEVIKTDYTFQLQTLEHPDKQNHGRNATRNLALPFLNSRYTLLWDSDIVPVPDMLEQHLLLLTKYPKSVSVGKVEYLNRNENRWAAYLQTTGYNRYKHLDELPFRFINTQNMAIDTETFRMIGGMDDNLVSYGGDDIELSFRIQNETTYLAIYNEKASGKSILTKSIETALSQMEQFGSNNLVYIQHKHLGSGTLYKTHFFHGNLLERTFAEIISSMWVRRFFIRLADVQWLFSIRNNIVHILVANSVLRGFKNTSRIAESKDKF